MKLILTGSREDVFGPVATEVVGPLWSGGVRSRPGERDSGVVEETKHASRDSAEAGAGVSGDEKAWPSSTRA